MKIIPVWIKGRLKKSKAIVRIHTWALWEIYLLKDWWGTKIWCKTREVITPLGFKLTSGFHPAYRMMREGTFEVDETKLLIRLFGEVDVFVDIGANLGYYTCLGLLNSKHVVAVEPQSQNLRCLYQNIKSNGWKSGFEIFPLAVSAVPGVMTLYGASGPSASLLPIWAGYSSFYRQEVPISTLDILVGSRFVNQQLLIKIDVEGAEFDVLTGALELLTSSVKPIWLIEICSNEFHPAGFNPNYRNIFNLFFERGYSCFAISEKIALVRLADVDKWLASGLCASGTINYLFVDAAKNWDAKLHG